MHLRNRRPVLVVVCALLATTALLAGCSGDDSGSGGGDTTTSEADRSTTTAATDETEDEPAPTVPDGEFEEAVNTLNERIEAAGQDPCRVLAVFSTPTPTPSGRAQVEQAVGVMADLLRALAGAVPPDQAAPLETAATQLEQEAEAAGYTDAFLTGDTPPAALSSQEFGQAVATVQRGCTTTTTTTP